MFKGDTVFVHTHEVSILERIIFERFFLGGRTRFCFLGRATTRQRSTFSDGFKTVKEIFGCFQ